MKETIRRSFLLNGIEADEKELDKLEKFGRTLQENSSRFNLTSLVSDEEIAAKHFADSLLPAGIIRRENPSRILDVGTGAGFPGMPLKIFFPESEVLLLDSLRKRLVFLEEAADMLELRGIGFYHGRAEDAAREKDLREKFDMVVSRAVAPLGVLLEYCLPFVAPGGLFLAYKGPEGEKEAPASEKTALLLGAKLENFTKKQLLLGNDSAVRTFLEYRKISSTPAFYPRKAGLPAKKPLK